MCENSAGAPYLNRLFPIGRLAILDPVEDPRGDDEGEGVVEPRITFEGERDADKRMIGTQVSLTNSPLVG